MPNKMCSCLRPHLIFVRQARGDRDSRLCSGACSISPAPQSAATKGGSARGTCSFKGDHAEVKCKMFNVIGIGEEACESNTNAR